MLKCKDHSAGVRYRDGPSVRLDCTNSSRAQQ